MSTPKPRFTLAEHHDAGRDIYDTRAKLTTLASRIDNAYPRHALAAIRASRAIMRAVRELDHAKHEMEREMLGEGHGDIRVYYRPEGQK